ncbi:MAG: hypothetical protein OXU20_08960 [Myxococcales bacterium]|nr:hypothetical protein [Myxococcales bacterium]MDD9972010.1 hypothetical protein [Myxococcales bacterium]
MNAQVLIDGIVRQTTVLIAHVATAAGSRAQLATVANHVFLDLAQALQEQGVPRKVAADMFGMALRSYQQKVRRLTESASDAETTLWEAIYRHVTTRGVVARSEIARRFSRDDPASVAGILRDMVDSGLVYRTGRGDGEVYRIAPPEEVHRGLSDDSGRTIEGLAWVAIYQNGPVSRDRLLEQVRVPETDLDRALAALVAEGRVRLEEDSDGKQQYSSDQVLIPLGNPGAWGASLLDHHQVVVASMCAKLRAGKKSADLADQQGGSTFSFDVWPGHPCEEQALRLLSSTRQQLQALWDQVTTHNASGKPTNVKRVTFYCGQMVADDVARPATEDTELRKEELA